MSLFKKIKTRRFFLVLLLLILTSPAYAFLITSLDQASNLVQETLGGEVVKADVVEVDGKELFLIRVVVKGLVKEVYVDPLSGKISNKDQES